MLAIHKPNFQFLIHLLFRKKILDAFITILHLHLSLLHSLADAFDVFLQFLLTLLALYLLTLLFVLLSLVFLELVFQICFPFHCCKAFRPLLHLLLEFYRSLFEIDLGLLSFFGCAIPLASTAGKFRRGLRFSECIDGVTNILELVFKLGFLSFSSLEYFISH